MERLSSSAGDVPPELRQMLENMQQSGGFSIIGALLGFVFMMFAGVIFGALGGLLGALFFKKDGPPPPTPPIPQNPFGGTPFNPPPMPPATPPAALGGSRLRRRGGALRFGSRGGWPPRGGRGSAFGLAEGALALLTLGAARYAHRVGKLVVSESFPAAVPRALRNSRSSSAIQSFSYVAEALSHV